MILEIVDGSRLHSVASLDEEMPLSLRWHCNNNDNFVLGLCLGWFLPKAKSSTFYSVIGPCGPEVVRVVCKRTALWIFEFRSNTISNHLLRKNASM